MSLFRFKFFVINQSDCAMKVGTDAMVLGAWTQPGFEPNTILDAGTGTGVLALMMAQRFPKARIDAVEKDEKAFLQAQDNFRNNVVGAKCAVFHGDYLTFPLANRYDLIITNPPYFVHATPALGDSRHAARHTIGFSLVDWLTRSAALLSETGVLAMILPSDSMRELIDSQHIISPIDILEVYGKGHCHNRTCVLFGKKSVPNPTKNRITIRSEQGGYTDEYVEFTRDFHGVNLG